MQEIWLTIPTEQPSCQVVEGTIKTSLIQWLRHLGESLRIDGNLTVNSNDCIHTKPQLELWLADAMWNPMVH